jgi:hypothetical protein
MRLELAQELRETKYWLAQHKRDPFLWLMILGPLALAAITLSGVVVFPPLRMPLELLGKCRCSPAAAKKFSKLPREKVCVWA